LRRPLTLIIILISALLTTLLALSIDTAFYQPTHSYRTALSNLLLHPTITPLNSFLYNTDPSNLAGHGIHPRYNHVLINLPQLLGPALILFVAQIISRPQRLLNSLSSPTSSNLLFLSAISGTLVLSVIPHQEARFLLPVVPLLLSSTSLPISSVSRKTFLATWIVFNALLGILFGTYHQGGVVGMSLKISELNAGDTNPFLAGRLMPDSIEAKKIYWDAKHPVKIYWWRTYTPPTWLAQSGLGNPRIEPTELLGYSAKDVYEKILTNDCLVPYGEPLIFTAPRQSLEVVRWRGLTPGSRIAENLQSWEGEVKNVTWTKIHTEWAHIGLDHLDWDDDGIWGTLSKVIRRRGLTAWMIHRTGQNAETCLMEEVESLDGVPVLQAQGGGV